MLLQALFSSTRISKVCLASPTDLDTYLSFFELSLKILSFHFSVLLGDNFKSMRENSQNGKVVRSEIENFRRDKFIDLAGRPRKNRRK